ncbi:hypothetical protein C8T65DRAFT_638113 [Cerioporus squamosus]|nr:hypothetical protein C8T65DRAFT_638113 [Cerioporus squamosus]
MDPPDTRMSINEDRKVEAGLADANEKNDCDIATWNFPPPETIREELSKEFTSEQKEKVWTEAAEAVKASYEQLLGRWKEEMDTLLVYAGVSSAVLTAFNVESYHLLQPDPSDPTLVVLRQISAQLNGYTLTPPFLNTTHTTRPADLTPGPFQPPASAVWLNTLWFASLVFSFASALLALFVKQWIYEAMVGGTSRESARLRQYRLNGLLKWRVGTIVVVLPILLQLASVLFLAGLLVLLWTLHSTVAAITSLLVAIFFTFFLSVTIIPVFKSDCPYRSPASSAIYAVLRYTRNTVLRMIRRFCQVIYKWCTRGTAWIHVGRAQIERLGNFAYEASDTMPTWRGRDQNEIHQHMDHLNRGIVTTAYTTTADKKFLSSMPVIFSDLPPGHVAMCFADILDFMEAEWGQWHLPERLHYQDPITVPLCSLYGLRHMLARSEKVTGWTVDVQIILRHFFIGDEITERMAELACKSLCQLTVEDREQRNLFGHACATLKRMYDEQGARHTYDTLSHVKAMYEVEMAAWDPSLGFLSFRDTTQAVYVLLHCVWAIISGRSQLSPSQTDMFLLWGQQQLSRVHQWLRDLEWRGLHKGCLAVSGDAAAVLAFPHIASRYLVHTLIDPLIALCSMPGGLPVISEELVSTIEHTWASARLAYPHSADADAAFVWCTELDRIDARLRELRAIISMS